MPSTHKKPSETLRDEVNEARLEAWRKSRAEIAEQSRQERLRLAEAERQERLRKFEEEKSQRIRLAAEARARDEAARKAERMARAQALLPNRADVEAAARRLAQYRTAAARRLITQITLFVAVPTLVVAAYFYAVATPLYEARTQFLVVRDTTSSAPASGGVFGAARSPDGAANIMREFVLSPGMFETLTNKTDFSEALSDGSVDPLMRLRVTPLFQQSRMDQFDRFVDLAVNAGNDVATLKVRGLSPEAARAYSDAISLEVANRTADLSGSLPARITAVPIMPTSVSEVAVYPRRLVGTTTALFCFAGLFVLARIMISSIRVHASG